MFLVKTLRSVAVVGMLLVLAGCGGVAVKAPDSSRASAAAPARSGPMKVAILVPLTGDVAPVGRQLVNAAAIAIFEQPNSQVELLPFDTQGTVTGATRAANEARAANVDVVLGPLFGSNVAPVRQVFGDGNMVLLAFTNDSQQATGSTFALGVSVTAQVERMMSYLAERDKRRMVIIGPAGPYTERTIAAAYASAPASGGTVVRTATYPNDADFNTISNKVQEATNYASRRAAWSSYEDSLKAQVRAADNPAAYLEGEAARYGSDSVRGRMLSGMASVYRSYSSSGRNRALAEVIQRIEGVDAMPVSEYDAILLPVGDENLVAIGSMLDLYNAGRGFSQLTGTDVWHNVNLSSEPSLLGGWFTNVSERNLGSFDVTYRNNFQDAPEPIAVLGYMGARVAIDAAFSGVRPVTPEFVRRPEGFQGMAGTIRFGGDNLVRHPLSIFQVNPEGVQEIEGPVPTMF